MIDGGQVQPILIGRSRWGGLEFRIEAVEQGRPCWMVIQLPQGKALAKRLLASLEAANAAGIPSSAKQALNAAEAIDQERRRA